MKIIDYYQYKLYLITSYRINNIYKIHKIIINYELIISYHLLIIFNKW